MPQERIKNRKFSLDEIMSKTRSGNVHRTGQGDAIVKLVTKAPRSFDAENRTARFVMTSESVDRYGDIVRQNGLDLTNFLKNPQALMFHDSRNWPIGTWGEVEKVLSGRPKRTEGTLEFMDEGLDPDADRAANHVQAGTIRCVSIGFMPKQWESREDEDGWWIGFDFTEAELYECSLVPIPAQPDAIVKAAGGDRKLLLCLVEEALDHYERTPEGLIVPKSEYEKLYRTVREPLKKAPEQAKLPVTDDEQKAAELRSMEFEVAKLCGPTEGAIAAVEGELAGKLEVKDGKWHYVGDVADGDVVNFVVETKVENDKHVYSLVHKFSADGHKAQDGGWSGAINRSAISVSELSALDANFPVVTVGGVSKNLSEIADDELFETPLGKAIAERFGIGPKPEEKTAEAGKHVQIAPAIEVKDVGAVMGALNTMADFVKGIIGSPIEVKERVEPKFEAPAAPSAEEIAAARIKMAATRKRLAEKSFI